MHDRRPGKPQTKNGHAVNPRIRDCWTDVSRPRSYRCTIIASITSDVICREGGLMRLRGLTGDIRGWVERSNRTLIQFDRETHHLSRRRSVRWVSQELNPILRPRRI